MNSKSVKSNISSQLWSRIWLKWAWNPFRSCCILVAMYREKAAGRLISKQLLTSKGVLTSSILAIGQNGKSQWGNFLLQWRWKMTEWVFSEQWMIRLIRHYRGIWECVNNLMNTLMLTDRRHTSVAEVHTALHSSWRIYCHGCRGYNCPSLF